MLSYSGEELTASIHDVEYGIKMFKEGNEVTNHNTKVYESPYYERNMKTLNELLTRLRNQVR